VIVTLLLIILFLVAVVGLAVAVAGPAGSERRLTGLTMLGAGGLIFVVLAGFTMLTQVGTKEVGVVLSFGKPSGTLSNGLHLVAPWQTVDTLDEAIQTDNHVKDGGKTSDGTTDLSCVVTRIAHQAVTCADVSIRWRIIEGEAGNLYQNYRGFDAIRGSLVTRELQAATNAAFENYDVLAVDEQGLSTSPPLSKVGADILAQMRKEIGNQIEVESVIVPVLHFDDATQGRINALQAQIAQTRIAVQAEQTAIAQSKANSALAASVAKDPNVLVSKCLDIVQEAINKGYQFNALFSCFGANGTGVVVPTPVPAK